MKPELTDEQVIAKLLEMAKEAGESTDRGLFLEEVAIRLAASVPLEEGDDGTADNQIPGIVDEAPALDDPTVPPVE
jgi:hypothetical protein